MYVCGIRTLHVREGRKTYTIDTPYIMETAGIPAWGVQSASRSETDHAYGHCQVCGRGHSSELDRIEHWLLEGGGLRRTTDIGEKGLPVARPGVWIPGNPLPVSTVTRVMRRLRKVLFDLGYLHWGKRGGLSRPTGKVLRQLSADQTKAYVDQLYPPRCQGRCTGPRCRCCRMHHVGSWNKVADGFHRLAQYFRYERTFRDGPSWSHQKLLAIYNVTPTLQYRVPPPSMNPVPKAVAFREWLLGHEDAQKQIYGWMIWLGQAFGLRYSEWIAAEWPMEGPRFRVDFAAGKVYVTGKGRLGGKTRSVTITPEREAGLRRLAVWRESLGEKVGDDDVAVAPVLFPNLAPRHRRGSPRNPDVAAWNHRARKYVRAYNARCEEWGHSELILDSRLVSSHKIGRPVHIISLALAKVDDKVAMEETGIEDERTLARYKRFSDSERREMLSKTDYIGSGQKSAGARETKDSPREFLEALRRQPPTGKESAWNMILEGLLGLLGGDQE